MFLKQTSYKPRSNSQSSAASNEGASKGSASSESSPTVGVPGGTGSSPTGNNNSTGGGLGSAAERRRRVCQSQFLSVEPVCPYMRHYTASLELLSHGWRKASLRCSSACSIFTTCLTLSRPTPWQVHSTSWLAANTYCLPDSHLHLSPLSPVKSETLKTVKWPVTWSRSPAAIASSAVCGTSSRRGLEGQSATRGREPHGLHRPRCRKRWNLRGFCYRWARSRLALLPL
jgi:hypothetical protein